MREGMTQSRWLMVVILFLFLLFNQLMVYLIEPISTQFRMISSISDHWFDTNLPLDVIVAFFFIPIWGYYFDRHSRKRLLSLVGYLWGVSAWLMSLAPTLTTFVMSKSLSGISRGGYSGTYAFVCDLFRPTNRGKIFALLLLTQPLAIVLVKILSDTLVMMYWRSVLIFFGVIGFTLSLAIHFLFNEPKRGAMEPALMEIHMSGTYQFDWDFAKMTFRKPSLILIYTLIFIGTIPVVVMLEGVLAYFREVHALAEPAIYLSFFPSMLGILLGYPIGGLIGDFLFKYKRTGRLVVSLVSLVMPPIFLYYAFQLQYVRGQQFFVLILFISLFMSLIFPNLFSSIMDIILPELRASAIAIGLLFQSISILITPSLFLFMQNRIATSIAILWICITCWVICIFILIGLYFFFPQDVEQLRRHMAYRSHLEARLER